MRNNTNIYSNSFENGQVRKQYFRLHEKGQSRPFSDLSRIGEFGVWEEEGWVYEKIIAMAF